MSWYGGLLGPRCPSGLLPFEDALAALGDDGIMDRRHAEVPVANVVGTLSRPGDFDQEFRLVNKSLRERWLRLADAVASGHDPPPVSLVQLGELYFVNDGHHRVSVARSLGRASIPATVLRVCTIAYAMCCLRLAHLPAKAAERQFLERVPLPDEVRPELWLDRPADWMRLADAAEAWAFRRALETGETADRRGFARAWWTDEVVAVSTALRSAGAAPSLRDVQLYVTALALRDRLGVAPANWPTGVVGHV
jgi:hypothetical protein